MLQDALERVQDDSTNLLDVALSGLADGLDLLGVGLRRSTSVLMA